MKHAGLVLFVMAAFVAGCQKEICYDDIDGHVPPATVKYTIPGGWQGKFGRDADPPNLHFAALFKVEGKVTVEADAGPAILFGTWQLVGDSLKTVYTFPGGDSFEFAAKFVDTIPKLQGYWRAIPPGSGGGSFYLEKY